ncbi:unnamed protein product [Vicia faba]|uniref:Uncharacterized protein n=1 Tax=Vicia faba TaxID=3906 RepID=A0AAV0ZEU5_VICFA|nr:unnamed protein product [Vicia faba]
MGLSMGFLTQGRLITSPPRLTAAAKTSFSDRIRDRAQTSDRLLSPPNLQRSFPFRLITFVRDFDDSIYLIFDSSLRFAEVYEVEAFIGVVVVEGCDEDDADRGRSYMRIVAGLEDD